MCYLYFSLFKIRINGVQIANIVLRINCDLQGTNLVQLELVSVQYVN